MRPPTPCSVKSTGGALPAAKCGPNASNNSPRIELCATDPSARRTRRSGRLSGMELRVFTEPQQGASYDELLSVAQKAEHLGFGAFFRSPEFDHCLVSDYFVAL